MTAPRKKPVALVTGASQGIGRAVAQTLATSGYDLALLARHKNLLDATAQDCVGAGARACSVVADLSRSSQLVGAVEQVVEAFGGLNVLVNCAGIHHRARAWTADEEDWDEVLSVNLRGPMLLTARALPHIIKSEAGGVVFVGSMASGQNVPTGGGYCASKCGLLAFARSVFEDVREYGTKVCTISPGYVNTQMMTGRPFDPDRLLRPADVAEAVRWVLSTSPTACPTEILLQPQREPSVLEDEQGTRQRLSKGWGRRDE
jgi:NAD(P)-dependent dehydrogenase (short-subunit alcohol dehydrogenase family)